MPQEPADVLAAYAAAWTQTDAAKRLALLDTCWVDDGRYMDPSASVQGREALSDHIGRFHAAMPGARIFLTSGASTHNARAYFKWQMITADGAVGIDGVDFARFAEDGRLAEIVGFFGPPPAL